MFSGEREQHVQIWSSGLHIGGHQIAFYADALQTVEGSLESEPKHCALHLLRLIAWTFTRRSKQAGRSL